MCLVLCILILGWSTLMLFLLEKLFHSLIGSLGNAVQEAQNESLPMGLRLRIKHER